jgi:hypothetical protein
MISRRFAQAFPAALLVHACQTLCALFLAGPVAAGVMAPSAAETDGVRLVLVLLRLSERAGQLHASNALLPIAIVLLTGPFWRLLWLRASCCRDSLQAHAWFASARYLTALGVGTVCASYALLLLLAAGIAAAAAHRLWAYSHNERTQTIAALLAATPFLIALLHPLTVVDVAQAAVARTQTSCRAALRQGFAECRASRLVLRGLFALGTAALVGVGWYAARSLFGLSPLGSLGTLVATQLLALAAQLLRGLWFALLTDAQVT